MQGGEDEEERIERGECQEEAEHENKFESPSVRAEGAKRNLGENQWRRSHHSWKWETWGAELEQCVMEKGLVDSRRRRAAHIQTANNPRRAWRAAATATEDVRDTERTKDQTWFNDEMSCVSREHPLKIRNLLKKEVREGAAMVQQSGSRRELLQQRQQHPQGKQQLEQPLQRKVKDVLMDIVDALQLQKEMVGGLRPTRTRSHCKCVNCSKPQARVEDLKTFRTWGGVLANGRILMLLHSISMCGRFQPWQHMRKQRMTKKYLSTIPLARCSACDPSLSCQLGSHLPALPDGRRQCMSRPKLLLHRRGQKHPAGGHHFLFPWAGRSPLSSDCFQSMVNSVIGKLHPLAEDSVVKHTDGPDRVRRSNALTGSDARIRPTFFIKLVSNRAVRSTSDGQKRVPSENFHQEHRSPRASSLT